VRPVAHDAAPRREVGALGGVEDAQPAEQLEAPAPGMIQEDHRHPVVRGGVADRDVLAVAGELGPADRVAAERADEAGRAAAMLDIGPASLGDAGEKEAVAVADEVDFLRGQRIGGRVAVGVGGGRFIGLARAPPRLLGLDRRGEGEVEETVPHGRSPVTARQELNEALSSG
jgi:hypothetical protein